MPFKDLIGKRFQGHPWHQAMVTTDDQGILKEDAAEHRTLRTLTGRIVAEQVKVLHYEEGNVTTCEIGGSTVTTGKMSGCLLFKCTINGRATVGHVGTGSGTEAVNDAVKRMLKNFADRADVVGLELDDPNSHWSNSELGLGDGWASMSNRPAIIGGWEPGGQYFTCVMQQHDGGNEYTIIQKKDPHMRPWAHWRDHNKLRIAD